MSRTFTARWVFPVSGPPLANGTVTIGADRIAAVDPHGTRTPDEDFGNAAIIPGLVNAHAHLDLSGARGLIPPTDPEHFTDWLRGVIAYRRTRSPEEVQFDTRAGLEECLRFGTTLIGDIASEGASWDTLAGAETRAVVFYELIGLSRERAKIAWDAANAWCAAHPTTERCRPARSPHAPYSTRSDLIASEFPNELVAIHLAESEAERQLLDEHSGPFVEFLIQLGVWEPAKLVRHHDWVIIRHRNSGHALFIHCNYLTAEIAKYFHAGMSIVYCPRTHAAFGHPPHPFREFIARGVRVCLGTDSLASNPDLDILAEARFVRTRYPDFPGDQLLRTVTLSGAEALGWSHETGSLEVGKSADFVVVPLPDAETADPHELLFADQPGNRRTMFRGRWRMPDPAG